MVRSSRAKKSASVCISTVAMYTASSKLFTVMEEKKICLDNSKFILGFHHVFMSCLG